MAEVLAFFQLVLAVNGFVAGLEVTLEQQAFGLKGSQFAALWLFMDSLFYRSVEQAQLLLLQEDRRQNSWQHPVAEARFGFSQ